MDGAPRRRGRAVAAGGAPAVGGRGWRARTTKMGIAAIDGDRSVRGRIVEERERRGTFARAPSGSAPTSPPPVIGPVEDENMEGFRLSGRGRTQR